MSWLARRSELNRPGSLQQFGNQSNLVKARRILITNRFRIVWLHTGFLVGEVFWFGMITLPTPVIVIAALTTATVAKTPISKALYAGSGLHPEELGRILGDLKVQGIDKLKTEPTDNLKDLGRTLTGEMK